jgi:hypothetical protein
LRLSEEDVCAAHQVLGGRYDFGESEAGGSHPLRMLRQIMSRIMSLSSFPQTLCTAYP